MMPPIPLPYKLLGGFLGVAFIVFVFLSWKAGIEREAYKRGQNDMEIELAQQVEELKQEHAKQAAELREQIIERDERYAEDIADITRQALAGASADRVAVDSDTRRMLNARTLRTNTDIEEASRRVDSALPAATVEEP